MPAGVVRANGIDGVGGMAFESARRKIEREDIAFANANKHRLGWQTMAKIRAVNMDDLRRACDQGSAVLQPASAPPAKPKGDEAAPRKAPPPLDPLAVLRAIQRGAASHEDLSDLLQVTLRHAKTAIADLKARGWLAGHAGSFTGWVITKAGDAALRIARP